jgi:nicotinate phosphoribosyltransferase
MAARASYLAGFDGTATVLAAPLFDIPVYGTMAHSFVQAHDQEGLSFEHFARSLPGNVILLIDTYDTEAAAEKVVRLAPVLAREGIKIKGVRLDSGDLAEHARKVRRILDEGGLRNVTIFASGSVDEYLLKRLSDAQAPIDGFGIGTHLDTSADAPYLDCAYKLVEYAGVPRRKRSEGKVLWPGRKQVYRRYDKGGRMESDILTLENDTQNGEALIQPVMRSGKRLLPVMPLRQLRERTLAELSRLPERLRSIEPAEPYPVSASPKLCELAKEVDERQARMDADAADGRETSTGGSVAVKPI